MACPVLLIRIRQKGCHYVNQHIAHGFWSQADLPSPDADEGLDPFTDVPVGDVVVRPGDGGYGIFNYRGERILEQSFRTLTEAERLAAEIVAPWEGRVRVDPGNR